MDVAITKMSSKGQIVLPLELRKDIVEGEKLLIIKHKNQFILKKASDLDVSFKDDIDFAQKTQKAWNEYEQGKFKSINSQDFLKKLEQW